MSGDRGWSDEAARWLGPSSVEQVLSEQEDRQADLDALSDDEYAALLASKVQPFVPRPVVLAKRPTEPPPGYRDNDCHALEPKRLRSACSLPMGHHGDHRYGGES